MKVNLGLAEQTQRHIDDIASQARRALIIGRAHHVWSDLTRVQSFGWTLQQYDAVLVINRMGRDFPYGFNHWVGYHPELFPHWAAERVAKGLTIPESLMYWSGIFRGRKLGEKVSLPIQYCRFSGGSSALLAVKVAIDGLGMNRVVLVGCPMEDTPRYDDPAPWQESTPYRETWQDELQNIVSKVRSMSGWTQELLGAPTREWLV